MPLFSGNSLFKISLCALSVFIVQNVSAEPRGYEDEMLRNFTVSANKNQNGGYLVSEKSASQGSVKRVFPSDGDLASANMKEYRPAGDQGDEAGIARKEILLDIDYTEGFQLKSKASQIVIGNPVIADITVRDDKYIFLSGKSPGRTNMLVYGSDGALKERYNVMVRDPNTYLTVFQGAQDKTHYDCLPNCQRVLRIEDSGTAAEDQRAKISANLQMIDGRAARAQEVEMLNNQALAQTQKK